MFTGEQGSRVFVYCSLGKDVENVHGQFVRASKPEEVSDFVLSEQGAETQKRIWVSLSHRLTNMNTYKNETIEILTKVDSRIPEILKSHLS
jgi:carbamate kinase